MNQSPKNQPTFNINQVGTIQYRRYDRSRRSNRRSEQRANSFPIAPTQISWIAHPLLLLAREDELLRAELDKHLSLLKRDRIIDAWCAFSAKRNSVGTAQGIRKAVQEIQRQKPDC